MGEFGLMKVSDREAGEHRMVLGRSLVFLLFFITVGTGSPEAKADQAPDTRVVNAVGKAMPPDAAPLSQQVYSFLLPEPTTLDIGIAVYEATGAVFSFEALTRLDHNNELVPAAAESWEASPDGMRWTFHLRRGARWSDGRPVTAHDFEYAFKRMIDPASANRNASFYYEIEGARAFNQGLTRDSSTVGVRAVNDYTLVIQTTLPCPYLPLITSFPTSVPVPRWQVEKYGPGWSEPGRFVTNSTYKLESWDHGSRFEFVLDPNYNGPHKGYVERIIGKFLDTRMMAGGTLAYENDEIDFQDLSPIDLPRIRKHPRLSRELDISKDFITHFLFFNADFPPFDNLKVRQAISHAIDRAAICRVLLQGTGVPAFSMLPPGFPGHAAGKYRDVQRFDPERAKQRLREAGYPDGRGFPRIELWINNVGQQQVAQAVQEMLKSHLGIDMAIRVVENISYRTAQYQRKVPFSLIQYHYDYPDPNNMLAMVWRSQPRGYSRHPWKNDEFDRLVDEAASEMDAARRMHLYDRAQRVLSEDVGAVFLYYGKRASLRKPWLRGIRRDRDGEYPFWGNNTGYFDIYIGNLRR